MFLSSREGLGHFLQLPFRQQGENTWTERWPGEGGRWRGREVVLGEEDEEEEKEEG